ncbi:CRISPR-associated protein Cas5 [Thermococcus sp. 4557]|uniref:CRISPR-associated protein Cas5 n=1 Tax=Thermococcus sp. (strain CGMCC 1.5172 / 4557) TaxID=1042877 RepID=UPI000219E8C0|nr:CRISPR-associated protein Cas5 [Thermococcus sp. 4557]AEK72019.1 CRISPR-associated protein Cas5 [Thermococcus sp. 4557]
MLGLVLEVRPLQAHFRIPYNSLLLDSYPFPPRTTAIGLVAGAMGLPEGGYRELLKEMRYGVIVEDPGVRVEEKAAIFKSPDSPLYPITKVLFHKPRYRMFFAGDDDLIERAYDSLIDPVFTPYLGDSESLMYPAKRDYVRIVEVNDGKESILRSIIPGDEYTKGARFVLMKRTNLTPREYRMPVDFTYGRGKGRRAVYRKVVAFAGGYVELANPIDVLLFDGEPVFAL